MKVILGTRYGGGITPGDHCGDALKMLGHEVLTVGPSTDPHTVQDYNTPGRVILGNVDVYDIRRVISETGFQPDLVFQVEPGVFFENIQDLTFPIATWFIDSLLVPIPPHPILQNDNLGGNYLGLISQFLFTSKLPHLSQYRAWRTKANHLPLAVDPDTYKPFEKEKKYDVAFIGNPTYEERQFYLSRLKKNGFIVWDRGGLIRDDYCRKLNEAYIGFNHGHVGEMNMRFFELAAMGVFQVCNICHGQEAVGFIDGKHLVNYVTDIDLVNTINHYLRSEQERQEIIRNARQLVLEKHTYVIRMRQMLEVVANG